MLNIIGKNIKKERVQLKLDVPMVSKLTKISVSNIYSIERGERFGKSIIIYLDFLKKQNININNIFETSEYLEEV